MGWEGACARRGTGKRGGGRWGSLGAAAAAPAAAGSGLQQGAAWEKGPRASQ